jgi:hypothetical protein
MEHPTFFSRLTSVVWAEANSRGLLRGTTLPGGASCDDLAIHIADAVVRGKRQWKTESNAEFIDACKSAIRSVVDNWKKKADHITEWKLFSAATENWDESGEVDVFPAFSTETPTQTAIAAEVLEKEQNELLALLELVDPNTLDEQIVQELYDDPYIKGRAEMMSRLQCSESEYDPAFKRLKRLAAKIHTKEMAGS